MSSTSNMNATEIERLRKEGVCIQDLEPSHNKFSIGLTLQEIFVLVGGICTILTIVNVLLVWASHLIWRTNFAQQKQMMRIVLLPAVFAVLSWPSVYEYRLNTYLASIPKLYEAYAVACFYQFMLQVLTNTENEHEREQFMAHAERQTRRKHKKIHDRGSLRWYKVRSMQVFQAPFIALLGTIATEILVSVLCPTTKTSMEAKFAIQILLTISVISALVAKANIYIRFRQEEFKHARIIRKFLSFKGMVWLFVHQQIIMEIISFAKAVNPTYYMSMADFNIGVPAFMIMCECAIFSVLFFFSLSGWMYRSSKQVYDAEDKEEKSNMGAPVSAYLVAFFFPTDIFVQTWRGMKTFVGSFKGRSGFDYTGGAGASWSQRQQDRDIGYEPYTQNFGMDNIHDGRRLLQADAH